MSAIHNQKIRCSVGILTFNSEMQLRRALESVKDFSDIIIADGGSTDQTLVIAAEFGCTIIEQAAKRNPGPEPRHPITDFAVERNQLVAAAKEDWFLWIDSDEHIASELEAEIRALTEAGSKKHGYRIPMYLQSPDAAKTYQLPKTIYQMRLINRTKGGTFMRPIHETYVFNEKDNLDVGTLKGAWYVPISKPDFATYRWAVNYRLAMYHKQVPPTNFGAYLYRAWYRPLRNSVGILLRIVTSYLTIPRSKIPPFFYFRNRFYSQWVTLKVVHRLYFGKETQ